VLALLLAAGFFGLVIWTTFGLNRIAERQLAEHRAMAHAQFGTWLQSPAAAQLRLGPGPFAPAHFIEDKPRRSNEPVDHYCLTWFLRNQDGHYVMLMSTPNEKPFVKVLEDRYAKVVLKAKYQPPG